MTRSDRTDRKKAIVCFAGNDWWIHNPYTEKQWMRRLAKDGYGILFVNSIGIGFPNINSPKLARRIGMKLRSLLRWLRKDEGVWVLTPLVIPLWSIRGITLLNIMLLTAQIRLILLFLGIPRPVFWSGLPTAALLLPSIPHSSTVYFVQDDFLTYFEFDRMHFSAVPEHHARLLKEADAVVYASSGMFDEHKEGKERAHYLPHGFQAAFLEIDLLAEQAVPPSMQHIPHPIVGYWGSLEGLQDRALIHYLASEHPDWSLVFIGKPMYDNSEFSTYQNIHFLGYVEPEKLPSFGIHFDVAVITFLQCDSVKYACPIKIREYFALGKPVVTPYILEVEKRFPDAIPARSHEEFVRGVEHQLRTDSVEKRLARRKYVEHETWEYSAGRVRALLESLSPNA